MDKILIVEDSMGLSDALCRNLQDEGFSVSAASCLAQARKILDSGIDLCLLDLNRKRSIMSTLTNARPLTWPAVLVSPACEFRPVISVTMEADLPEMTGRFDPYISEAR